VRTFYNPNQEHISKAMMGKSDVQILKRTDGWCESVNQTWDSIPECPMMNRDGYRPIQRVIELAIYNMGGNEGTPLVLLG